MTILTTESVDARQLVDRLIADALQRRASDIHVDPTATACEVKFRIDGLLEAVATPPPDVGRMLVTRLMVMAKLLTYRLDVPQEGRAEFSPTGLNGSKPIELRVSIMPTTHGPRAAVRLPAELLQPQTLEQLMLPPDVLDGLKAFASADSGMLVVTGPAGSGKTTTIYALLRHIAQVNAGLSIVTLEEPVERDLPGVVQIEVSPFGQLTYERALRSILRQDPQVLMPGEIRDAATASIAIQAALSCHRLICTLHAATPAGALIRLLEMSIRPSQLTSPVHTILTQRLLRRSTASPTDVPGSREAGNASGGRHSDYQGRLPIGELVTMNESLRRALLSHSDLETLRRAYESQPNYRPLRSTADHLLNEGLTDER